MFHQDTVSLLFLRHLGRGFSLFGGARVVAHVPGLPRV